jgi:hypothetical protein
MRVTMVPDNLEIVPAEIGFLESIEPLWFRYAAGHGDRPAGLATPRRLPTCPTVSVKLLASGPCSSGSLSA